MYACCMVIATVLKADNMTFHRFFNTTCVNDEQRETNSYISYPSNPPGSSQDFLSRKKNQQPKSQKTEMDL